MIERPSPETDAVGAGLMVSSGPREMIVLSGSEGFNDVRAAGVTGISVLAAAAGQTRAFAEAGGT